MLIRSWVESANRADHPFPLNNLPYGVFAGNGSRGRCCVAIGDFVLDLGVLEAEGLLKLPQRSLFGKPRLNDFMAGGKSLWASMRDQLLDLLAEDGHPKLSSNKDLRERALQPSAEVAMLLPFKVAGYTDFYSGRQHAFNVGSLFRGPENALPPNWLHIPTGYNGRASTVVVSGTDIRRPLGQLKPPGAETPVFGPSRRLDFELEMGAVVGTGNQLGEPVTTAEAEDMIFGYVLLNDWSARDIQAWEYQPLGPFQGKVFGTTISPWVVTSAALAPFRCSTPAREKTLLPYLTEHQPGLYDIKLEVLLQPAEASRPTTISRANYNRMYYSAAQQLTHHAIGGCLMETGDLLGSGAISGPAKTEYGSLLELSWGGKEPLKLDTGETRTFLEDGDRVTFTGFAESNGYKIGFGECAGRILPSVAERQW
jgi:fumarylacetoacetase